MGQDIARRTGIAVKDGAIKGLKTGWMLIRIMLPVYIAVVFLKYTPVMPFLERTLEPVMKLFRLPANAALPIVAGIFSDEYAVVAALEGFDFSKAAITTIAMIALCFHSIPVETVLARKIGFAPGGVAAYRFILAIVTGIAVGFLGSVIA
ncbi:MAG: nucleoside recognition domain-containing protein [Clostridiales Family XIII bacterium]|jgi:hypothetical protein|nr:nucleoside recognition domain-containing protein [Clostridiales Family XIII bacterium]